MFATFEDIELFFKRYDTNRDGKVRYSEFCSAVVPIDPYHAALVNRRSSNYIKNTYYRDDVFTAGTRLFFKDLFKTHFSVERQAEYLRQRLSRDPDFNLFDAFKSCDINDDGIVTRSEIRRLLDERRIFVSELEISALMDKLDKDKDGRVSYSEFADELRPRNNLLGY